MWSTIVLFIFDIIHKIKLAKSLSYHGQMPDATPHLKHYFIIFLNDHTHALNIQLLAMKDQALCTWMTIHVKWKNMSRLRVKIFCLDNGGEFINDTFTNALEAAGIVRQCLAPYAHQQNGKAK